MLVHNLKMLNEHKQWGNRKIPVKKNKCSNKIIIPIPLYAFAFSSQRFTYKINIICALSNNCAYLIGRMSAHKIIFAKQIFKMFFYSMKKKKKWCNVWLVCLQFMGAGALIYSHFFFSLFTAVVVRPNKL